MTELLVTLILTLVLLIVNQYFILKFVNKKKYHNLTLHVFGVILFALTVQTSFYLAPISPTNGLHGDFLKDQLQLVPFNNFLFLFTPGKTIAVLEYALGNLLLFLPLGFFLPLLWKAYRNWLRVTLYGLLVSLTIECTQLLLQASSDINDIIWNVIGVFLGFILFALIQAFLPSLTTVTYLRIPRNKKISFILIHEPTLIIVVSFFINFFTGLFFFLAKSA